MPVTTTCTRGARLLLRMQKRENEPGGITGMAGWRVWRLLYGHNSSCCSGIFLHPSASGNTQKYWNLLHNKFALKLEANLFPYRGFCTKNTIDYNTGVCTLYTFEDGLAATETYMNRERMIGGCDRHIMTDVGLETVPSCFAPPFSCKYNKCWNIAVQHAAPARAPPMGPPSFHFSASKQLASRMQGLQWAKSQNLHPCLTHCNLIAPTLEAENLSSRRSDVIIKIGWKILKASFLPALPLTRPPTPQMHW